MSTEPDATVLDANAIAGLLAEVFAGAEMTSASRACQSCGQRHPIGEHRIYRGAGMVLRCPACNDIAMIMVEGDGWREVRTAGYWSLRVPGPAAA
jgi:hypothetical protein